MLYFYVIHFKKHDLEVRNISSIAKIMGETWGITVTHLFIYLIHISNTFYELALC